MRTIEIIFELGMRRKVFAMSFTVIECSAAGTDRLRKLSSAGRQVPSERECARVGLPIMQPAAV